VAIALRSLDAQEASALSGLSGTSPPHMPDTMTSVLTT
jgi:hypothetical protein